MRSEPKAATVSGGTAAVLTWAAGWAAQKYNLPLEVAAVAVGGVFTFVGRWAAKLIPSPKKTKCP